MCHDYAHRAGHDAAEDRCGRAWDIPCVAGWTTGFPDRGGPVRHSGDLASPDPRLWHHTCDDEPGRQCQYDWHGGRWIGHGIAGTTDQSPAWYHAEPGVAVRANAAAGDDAGSADICLP